MKRPLFNKWSAHLRAQWESWWYDDPPRPWLFPLACIYRCAFSLHRLYYRMPWMSRYRPRCPLMVVGGLLVGGLGKTPVVIALVRALMLRGYRVGVVSRGYGRTSTGLQVSALSNDVTALGDEPYLIAKRTGAVVAVAERRVEAVKWLEQVAHCDVIISDDGLLHMGIQPSMCMILHPSQHLLNQALLPQGPYRARPTDFPYAIDINEGTDYEAILDPVLHQVNQPDRTLAIEDLKDVSVAACVGVARPWRFMAALENFGLRPMLCAFADHHRFVPEDFDGITAPIVMTEKDAVKCMGIAPTHAWFVQMNVRLADRVLRMVMDHVQEYKRGKKVA